jgi:hypothetical protein
VPATPVATVAPAVEVAVGDNLWLIAVSAVARETGREPGTVTDDEVARYWRVVCDVNRDRLRSGDVDLIYPGEVVVLPSADDGEAGGGAVGVSAG